MASFLDAGRVFTSVMMDVAWQVRFSTPVDSVQHFEGLTADTSEHANRVLDEIRNQMMCWAISSGDMGAIYCAVILAFGNSECLVPFIPLLRVLSKSTFPGDVEDDSDDSDDEYSLSEHGPHTGVFVVCVYVCVCVRVCVCGTSVHVTAL